MIFCSAQEEDRKKQAILAEERKKCEDERQKMEEEEKVRREAEEEIKKEHTETLPTTEQVKWGGVVVGGNRVLVDCMVKMLQGFSLLYVIETYRLTC